MYLCVLYLFICTQTQTDNEHSAVCRHFHLRMLQELVGITEEILLLLVFIMSVDRTQEYGRRVSFFEVDGSCQDF